MTGKVPVRMQVAWFDLQWLLHTTGRWVLLQRELHRASRCVHVVAS